MQYLNGEYYNSLTSIAKEQIGDALWYTGATNNAKSGIFGHYEVERSEETGSGKTAVYTTTWSGKIGLIYPSDYGYAGGSTCTNVTGSTCGTTNWLKYTSSYWTITSYTSFSDNVFDVLSGGSVSYANVSKSKDVLPTTYLAPDVQIIGGNGGTEPYILS